MFYAIFLFKFRVISGIINIELVAINFYYLYCLDRSDE